jgi:hypothetical protein
MVLKFSKRIGLSQLLAGGASWSTSIPATASAATIFTATMRRSVRSLAR